MENKKHYFSDPEEGQNAFDQLAERFYEKNFGQMSKSDIEVLMFSIYIEHVWKAGRPDGDHYLAEKLGVPESKIRRLKVQKELNYPRKSPNWNWIDVFLEYARYATFDDDSKTVKVSISDPNIKRHVEARLEEMHCQSDNSFNPKILQIRADHFIRLCVELSNEGGEEFNQIEAIKRLNESAAGRDYLETEGLVQLIQNGFKNAGRENICQLGKDGIVLLLEALQSGGLKKPFLNVLTTVLRKQP